MLVLPSLSSRERVGERGDGADKTKSYASVPNPPVKGAGKKPGFA
jgi:hypothetical protein